MFTSIAALEKSPAQRDRVQKLERWVQKQMGTLYNKNVIFPVACIRLSNSRDDYEWVMDHRSVHIATGYYGNHKIKLNTTIDDTPDQYGEVAAKNDIAKMEHLVQLTLGTVWSWAMGLGSTAAEGKALATALSAAAAPAPNPLPDKIELPTAASVAATSTPAPTESAEDPVYDRAERVLGVPVPASKSDHAHRKFRKDIIAALQHAADSGMFEASINSKGNVTAFTILV